MRWTLLAGKSDPYRACADHPRFVARRCPYHGPDRLPEAVVLTPERLERGVLAMTGPARRAWLEQVAVSSAEAGRCFAEAHERRLAEDSDTVAHLYERVHRLEDDLAEALHRATVAERALREPGCSRCDG